MKTGSYFIILFIILCSCHQKRFDTEQALWNYIKEESHGYIQHKAVNGVDFTLTHLPTDLLVKRELGNESTEADIDSLRKKYGKYMYFNLSMAKNNRELLSNVAGNREQFGSMVNRLSFGMENKVHLYTSKRDTILLADYLYPRMYGMSGGTTLLFIYPRDEKSLQEEYLNFTIEDIGLHTGEVRFKLPTPPIKNEPGLHLGKNK